MVLIRNRDPEAAENLQLATVSGAPVTARFDPLPKRTLPAGGDLTVRLAVTSPHDEPAAGTLGVWLSYDQRGGKDHKPVTRAAHAGLKLVRREPAKVADIAELKVVTAPGTLDEYRESQLYVTVTNRWDRPFTQVEVSVAEHPAFAVQPVRKAKLEEAVQPGEVRVAAFTVSPKDATRRGDYALLVTAALAWDDGGRKARGVLTATQSVAVDIAGESVILQLLGVPSLLLLPGFLMVSTFLALRKPFLPPPADGGKAGQEGPSALSREFWLIAITLSLLAAFLYPWVTDLLGPRRDYLRGYGLLDIVYLWCGSLVVGVAAALAVAAVPRLRRALLEPQSDDSPETALRKAARSLASLAQVSLREGTDPARYFLFREVGDKVWVAPAVHWSSAPGEQSAGDAVDKQIAALGSRRPWSGWFRRNERRIPLLSPWGLARILARARRRGVADVWWDPAGKIKGPTRFTRNEVELEAPRPTYWKREERGNR
jgi:hypothetical protein